MLNDTYDDMFLLLINIGLLQPLSCARAGLLAHARSLLARICRLSLAFRLPFCADHLLNQIGRQLWSTLATDSYNSPNGPTAWPISIHGLTLLRSGPPN